MHAAEQAGMTVYQVTEEQMNTGNVSLNSGDTQIILISSMITRDGGNNFQNVCALQSLSDSALKYYYNDFKTCVPIGIEPISSEIPQRYELLQNYPESV